MLKEDTQAPEEHLRPRRSPTDTEGVRRRLALLPVLAALPFLSGCLWWGYGAGVGSSEEETATLEFEAPAEPNPEDAIRAAIPTIEVYYVDKHTYAGLTSELLREDYAFPFSVRIVVRDHGRGYCVEAPAQAPSAHYEGPAGRVAAGPCPSK